MWTVLIITDSKYNVEIRESCISDLEHGQYIQYWVNDVH
jgi:hypothetical protein